MKCILGIKKNMVRFFDEAGKAYSGTVIVAGPATVVQVKTTETDGYNAIQIGFGIQKKQRVNKPMLGHVKDMGPFQHLQEFRVDANEIANYKVGDVIETASFASGDKVVVTGVSKGKGFQGVVKRHGFKGGPRSHGQKHSEREPGSIGGGLRTRVPKGMRMGGRTGSDTITIKNLKVLGVDTENHEIVLSGPIPGRRGTLISLMTK